jgi:transglutaminase-like putative cysteine protease
VTARIRASVPIVGRADLVAALELATRAAAADMRASARKGRPIPPIYSSGVRYIRRDPGERWQTPTETMRRGGGDCEDLSIWRAAELRAIGEPARVIVYRSAPRVLHAVVRRGDGRIEDPSRRLGMM